ncbi:very short patch repair endonuclease [Leptospira santarosai]|uniref:Very short patch repair endonuclease n=1 Tax=Leptospira santarosai TaxID=28183 RepID=A0AB73M974_9LEPT|nr:DNA mismatch endonuclease Vsr [Leptospira santarosai]ONF90883.1 very short patch repair endonuclease [Leptospira santarosai]
MADTFTKEKRSSIMANISGKDSKPEVLVRKFLFSLGYRYRKNYTKLIGKPDIVLKKYNTILFVHGCFWHGHRNCKFSTLPVSNKSFWENKINNNSIRDKKNSKILKKLGWKIIIIWQCELMNKKKREKSFSKIIRKLSAKQ